MLSRTIVRGVGISLGLGFSIAAAVVWQADRVARAQIVTIFCQAPCPPVACGNQVKGCYCKLDYGIQTCYVHSMLPE